MRFHLNTRDFITIKNGWEVFDIHLPHGKSGEKVRAIDISIITNCDICNKEIVLKELNENVLGDFCDQCLNKGEAN
jgi:hypothetical protein